MGVRHLSSNIKGMLKNYNDKKLGEMFEMNGKSARQELERLRDKGDKVIDSEGCTTFDAVKGCQCHLLDEK